MEGEKDISDNGGWTPESTLQHVCLSIFYLGEVVKSLEKKYKYFCFWQNSRLDILKSLLTFQHPYGD